MKFKNFSALPHLQRRESGVTVIEFAISTMVFSLSLFGVIEFSRLLFTHNALTEAARRGTRYAVIHSADPAAVQNVVVFNDPNPPKGVEPKVKALKTANIKVNYSPNFGVKLGTASVSITGYRFRFIVPFIGTYVLLPEYKTTLTAESAGCVPPLGCGF